MIGSTNLGLQVIVNFDFFECDKFMTIKQL